MFTFDALVTFAITGLAKNGAWDTDFDNVAQTALTHRSSENGCGTGVVSARFCCHWASRPVKLDRCKPFVKLFGQLHKFIC